MLGIYFWKTYNIILITTHIRPVLEIFINPYLSKLFNIKYYKCINKLCSRKIVTVISLAFSGKLNLFLKCTTKRK